MYETFEMTYGRQLSGLLMLAAGAMQYAISVHFIARHLDKASYPALRPQADGQLNVSYVFDDAVSTLVQVLQYFRPTETEEVPAHVAEKLKSLGYDDLAATVAFEIVSGTLRPNPLGPKPAPESWEGRVRAMVSGLGGWGSFLAWDDEATSTKPESTKRPPRDVRTKS